MSIALYVEDEKHSTNICEAILAIEGVTDIHLVPTTSNLYQISTTEAFDTSSIAARAGASVCVSRSLDDNHVTLLTVTGMTCNSCVKLIETTVGQMEGINNVKVSLSRSEAFIEYQSTVTTAENLCTAIYDMGFDASVKIIINNNDSLTDRVTLSVIGMVCMSCVNNIETNVSKMAGVTSVNASLEHNTATIEYHPAKITSEKLCQAIEDLGFEASTTTEHRPSCKTVIVGIEGMTCGSCIKLIENTVGAADGIVKISVSLDKKEAVIEYNCDTLSDEDVKNAIEDTGFEVTYVKDEGQADLEVGAVASSKICHEKLSSTVVSKVTNNDVVSCIDDTDGETCRVQINVTGMSCSSCVNKIESSLSSKDGVHMIRVGLLAEKAEVKYNPSITNPEDLVRSIKNLGFGASLVDTVNISEGKIELMVTGMSCSSCVSLIERTLAARSGIKSASVALATGKALVEFDPNKIGPRDIINIINVCHVIINVDYICLRLG